MSRKDDVTYIILDEEFFNLEPENNENLDKLAFHDAARAWAKKAQDFEKDTYSEASIMKLDSDASIRSEFLREFERNGYRQFYTDGKSPTSFSDQAKNFKDKYGFTVPQANLAVALIAQKGDVKAPMALLGKAGQQTSAGFTNQEDVAEIPGKGKEEWDAPSNEEGSSESDLSSDLSRKRSLGTPELIDDSHSPSFDQKRQSQDSDIIENADFSDNALTKQVSPLQRGIIFALGSEVYNSFFQSLFSGHTVLVPRNKKESLDYQAVVMQFSFNFSEYQILELTEEKGSGALTLIASGSLNATSRLNGGVTQEIAKAQILGKIVFDKGLNISFTPGLFRLTEQQSTCIEGLESSRTHGFLINDSIPGHSNVFVSTPTGKAASEFELPEFFEDAVKKLRRAEIFEQLYGIVGEARKHEIFEMHGSKYDDEALLLRLHKELEHAVTAGEEALRELISEENSEVDPFADRKKSLKNWALFFLGGKLELFSSEDKIKNLQGTLALIKSFTLSLRANNSVSFNEAEKDCKARLGMKVVDCETREQNISLLESLFSINMKPDFKDTFITAKEKVELLSKASELHAYYSQLCNDKGTSNEKIKQVVTQLQAIDDFFNASKEDINKKYQKFVTDTDQVHEGFNDNVNTHTNIKGKNKEILDLLAKIQYAAAVRSLQSAVETAKSDPNRDPNRDLLPTLKLSWVSDTESLIEEGNKLVVDNATSTDARIKMTNQIKDLDACYRAETLDKLPSAFDAYKTSTASIKTIGDSSKIERVRFGTGNPLLKYLGFGLVIAGLILIGVGLALFFTGIAAVAGVSLIVGGVFVLSLGGGYISMHKESGWAKASSKQQSLFNKKEPEITGKVRELQNDKTKQIVDDHDQDVTKVLGDNGPDMHEVAPVKLK